MNRLLRPPIRASFRASSGVGPCDVLFNVRLGSNPLRLPGGTPFSPVSRRQFMKHPGQRKIPSCIENYAESLHLAYLRRVLGLQAQESCLRAVAAVLLYPKIS